MSRFINVASVEFSSKAIAKTPDAAGIVLDETRQVMDGLRGYGLDLVVFSEGVESRGMTIENAEEISSPGVFLQLYQDFAAEEKCHVAGSIKIKKYDRVYNSIVFIDDNGEILGVYNKTFLTIGEIEAGLSSGDGAVVIESRVGRLGGAVCFDLNFLDLRQEYVNLKPDIICFASMYHGGEVQKTWAYECRSFFVSALPFHGCGIIDPFGRALKTTDCYNRVARVRINLDRVMVHLDYNRDRFAEIEKKYPGEVIIDIPANNGSALIYSLTEKRTAMDVVDEYGLELLDDYFRRAIAANAKNRV